jgi:2-haloacid dehalogenase
VYGTLIDVSGMGSELARPGLDGHALAAAWRRHQLEISWLLSLMERYEDFATVSGYALDAALAETGVDLPADEKAAALAALSELPAYEDAAAALAHLGAAGLRLAVLSNGSPAMLDAVLGAAGLGACFDAIVSVDEIGIYKPAPRVYHHAAARLGLAADELWLVSANPFDCAGAKSVSLGVVKVERAAALSYTFAEPPDLVVASLTELGQAMA